MIGVESGVQEESMTTIDIDGTTIAYEVIGEGGPGS